MRGQARDQLEAREGQARRDGVAERPVRPMKSGNADRGKGPWFKVNATSGNGQEIGKPENSNSVQKLQTALHAKAKEEPSYRFYLRYDTEATGVEQWLGELAEPHRLCQWLRKKHKVQGKGEKRYSNQYLYDELGLINLPRRTRDLPWAKA